MGPECLCIIYAALRSTSLFFFYLREAENLANCKTESYSAALILLAWPPAVMIRMCDRGRDNLITGLGTSSSCALLLPQCTCKGKENTGGGLVQPHSTQDCWEGPAGHRGWQKYGCNSRVREIKPGHLFARGNSFLGDSNLFLIG